MDRAHASAEEEGDESDGDLFTLRMSTLTALTSFLEEQAAELEARASLPTPQDLNVVAHTQAGDRLADETDHLGVLESRPQPNLKPVQVDEYKRAFKENWQLSQFWYTQDTAQRLAQAIRRVCDVNAQVAFMCCPTGYVAFKEIALPTQNALLLEYDRRFSIIAGANFVHYDLDESSLSPRIEALRGSQDVVVVDPPFHSEMSQRKIASTMAHVLRPGGRLVLLTGLTLSPLIDGIYQSPLPKLRRRGIVIEHDGVGRLATPYGCWTGGGAEGVDDGAFGEPIYDEL